MDAPHAPPGGPVEPVPAGTWVELHAVVLPAGQRAPQVPPETQAVPLEFRVKGWLRGPATVGEEATVVTPAGLHRTGRLETVQPAVTHGFGPPVPELAAVGRGLRALLAERGRQP